VPTNKQQREAAKRKLERQLVRRHQQDARRRQVTLISTIFGTIIVMAVVIVSIVMLTNDDKKTSASASNSATPTTSATPSETPTQASTTSAAGEVACTYTSEDATANPNLKEVGKPPAKASAKGSETVKMVTSRGEVDIQLNRASAPCSINSWDYLISKKFYDNTKCHRLVNQGIFVLQCGDPTATGSGGATYKYAEENLDKVAYGEGVVAMAKTQAPATTGSQFFIIWKDSNSGLSKDYSVVGKVIKGLDIVKAVAAGGLAADGTAPKLPISIKTMTIASK